MTMNSGPKAAPMNAVMMTHMNRTAQPDTVTSANPSPRTRPPTLGTIKIVRPIHRPNEVAIALPPLKRSQGEKA